MSHYVILLGAARPDPSPEIHNSKDIPAGRTGVRLGWDRPLGTFFATVATEGADPELDDSRIHLWVGASPDEITSVDMLQDALAAWVVIPRALRLRLTWDQSGGAQPTEFNPDAFRWFLVSGRIMAGGQMFPIFTGTHAADLPAGSAANDEIAARILGSIAQEFQDENAQWEQLFVWEIPRESMTVVDLGRT